MFASKEHWCIDTFWCIIKKKKDKKICGKLLMLNIIFQLNNILYYICISRIEYITFLIYVWIDKKIKQFYIPICFTHTEHITTQTIKIFALTVWYRKNRNLTYFYLVVFIHFFLPFYPQFYWTYWWKNGFEFVFYHRISTIWIVANIIYSLVSLQFIINPWKHSVYRYSNFPWSTVKLYR